MTIGAHTVTVAGQVQAPAQTNLARDPSLESGLTGIGGSSSGALYVAAWDLATYWTGTRSNSTTRTTSTPSNQIGSTYLTPATITNAAVVPITPGHVYSFAAYLRASVAWRGQVTVQWRTEAGANIGTTPGTITAVLPANTWVRVLLENVTALPGATRAAVLGQTWLPVGGVTVGGEIAWQDALTITNGPAADPYFDGYTAGCYWVGLPHQSQSVQAAVWQPGSLDLSCLVVQVAIVAGRSDSTDQPAAATATLDLDLADTWLPDGVEVGNPLTVTTRVGTAAPVTRFTGKITDITLGWDDAGADTPNAGTGQIIATATLADLGRRVIGDVPWPVEIDGARITRILTAAGMPATSANVDPGAVQILARDVDSTDALALAQEVAADAGGIVWQTRAGVISYADARHRHNLPVDLVLDVCSILVTPTWSKTLQGLTNKVSIGYGLPANQGADQPRYVASNATSIGRYGLYDYSIGTQLAALADAQSLAGLLLARNATPIWVMTALPVDVKGLSDADTATLLGLDMHSLVSLTGLPMVAPGTPTTALLWVEGWSETLTVDDHALELVVSGYCRTVPPPLWDDLDPAWTWDTLDPGLTWDGAACLGPPTTSDRWTDVPASARWDTTPPAVTWDTWDT